MTSAGPCWERQRGESERAYASFIRYRNIGPERSLERCRESVGEASVELRTLERHCSRFDWVERARAWDNHLQSARDQVAAEAAAEWERRRQAAMESAWQDAERLRTRAEKMLSFPLQRTVVERDEKGRETTTITPAKWSVWTAAQMLKLAAEIQAAVLAAVSKDPAEMTDAELRATSDVPSGTRLANND